MNKIGILSLSLLVLLVLIPACTAVQSPQSAAAPLVRTPSIIGTFVSNPSMINSGGTTTLLWNVAGASLVSIDNGIGKVEVAGTRVTAPSISTVYTISATNSAGTVTRSTMTTVNSLQPSPTQILYRVTGMPAANPGATPTQVVSARAGPAPVNLGSADTFAVLAGSTVTNTGPTRVKGNLGVSPGSAVTGFPPGTVNGAIYKGAGSAAGRAELDLTTAYNNAAGRTVAPIALAGNIGGRTLTPGIYKSTSSLAISSGDLTLDAQGNANAVFVFQMASTLTTTSGRQVILSGGAQAKNVFWQVGTSATLGTTSIFKGTIMADQSITLNTGATLNGRALARIGAVTLDSNSITVP